MKLHVLTDQSGDILAAHYTAAFPPARRSRTSGSSMTRIKPSEGESVHEVELPAELHQHILENTFSTEIFKYKVERHGEVMRLTRIS